MRASIILNTLNERLDYLKASIHAFNNQKSVVTQVIVSTVEGDKNMGWLRKQDVDLAVMKKADHPGYSPEGSFAQINNAVEQIKYEWVAFASSNDLPLPNKMWDEIRFCILGQHKVCYSNIHHSDSNLNILYTSDLGSYNRKKHQQVNFIADCSTVEAKIYKKYTPFRWEEYGNFSYWDLWLRIYEGEGHVFGHNDNATWHYRQDGGMHMRKRPPDYSTQRIKMLKTHENSSSWNLQIGEHMAI